jgi:hypothetical protein
MERREFLKKTSATLAVALSTRRVRAQEKAVRPDLLALAGGKGLKVFNRHVSPLQDGSRRGVRLDEASGQGLAYVDGLEFGNGTIELDIRGRDLQGQSFVGVAFHALDALTYDAIYFRPFNFRNEDPERRMHAVQYISMPLFYWSRLRSEHPGMYEKAVNPVPDPNDWFHARIVVASPTVRVFMGDATEPSLVVTQLGQQRRGMVGLWVDNFGGDFADLVIVPAHA